MESLKKRGRPRVGTGKTVDIHVRGTYLDGEKLRYLIEKRGQSKTKIVLDAISAQYNFERAKG